MAHVALFGVYSANGGINSFDRTMPLAGGRGFEGNPPFGRVDTHTESPLRRESTPFEGGKPRDNR